MANEYLRVIRQLEGGQRRHKVETKHRPKSCDDDTVEPQRIQYQCSSTGNRKDLSLLQPGLSARQQKEIDQFRGRRRIFRIKAADVDNNDPNISSAF